MTIGIVLFDDAEELDFAGPWEVFTSAAMLKGGGRGTRREVDNAKLIDWISRHAAKSTVVATVCTGAALLARTGHLDRRKATTNKAAMGWVMQQGPNVVWQRRARWVVDGRYYTSSGVSAGIDMALGLIARLHGRETAERAARVMEYVWNDDPDNDPFA